MTTTPSFFRYGVQDEPYKFFYGISVSLFLDYALTMPLTNSIHIKPIILQKGFTLLELITTFAIIGILITISYPSYSHYILKTRRNQAQIAIVDLAASLERYRSLHQTYIGANLANLEINEYTESDYYQLELNTATETSYLLKAIPVGTQAQDKTCGTLSLDESGQRNISGTGPLTNCW